jgi:hypothetical protein
MINVEECNKYSNKHRENVAEDETLRGILEKVQGEEYIEGSI